MSASVLWLGVDVGTQGVKVSLADGPGLVHAAAYAPLTSDRANGRHEQIPAQWIQQTRAAMAEAIGALSEAARARISGVAVCATSGTITTVDAAGHPLSPGLMYDDARAGSLSEEVAATDPALWNRLGYRIQPTWALPKIVWLARNDLLPSGTHVATQADIVAAALVGRAVASDWSHSLKSGYDLLELRWPTTVLDTLGIDPERLPPVVAPGSVLGESSAAWETATGLPAGTPIFAGMTDGCAAQLGAGTLALGDWHTVIGTTLVVKGVSDRIVVDDTGAVYSHRAPHDGLWFPGGASSVGAGAVSALFAGEDLAARTARIADTYANRLDAIPTSYPLVTTGERFPVIRPDALGFVRSAKVDHPLAEAIAGGVDPDTLFASVLLGVACVERLAVDTMEGAGVPVTGTFSSSGGGTKNAWWTQLRADLLGRSITVPVSAEGSIGMAILAAWAAGHDSEIPLPAVAARMSLVGSVFEPDSVRRSQLDDCYGVFRANLVAKGWLTA
ncbi:FGGY-family carbohydrate kinase [Cryobacterium sp. Y82]|uniref:FGGY-family carbohydrate kinase n=1 Tax=Cryobacterium sp. Y82 TaxID=2045017 RepID=UPI000CE3EE60|nr:FGGY family carbohydrate kinase [Cryobacterium sp. Y82]